MFHLWGSWLMALTFNMHLFTAPNAFFLFGCLQPGRACAIVALQGVVQSRMRHGSGWIYVPREPFLLLALGSQRSWNPGTALTWDTVDVGCAPRRMVIYLILETAASSIRAGKGSVRFSFHQTSLWPPQFHSTPGSPFTLGNKSASHTHKKHGQEKKRIPILRETKQQWAPRVVCVLLGSTQIAFLPWLCTAIEAGLQHLRPWHHHLGQDLELFQKAQETYTSGQKLGIHRAVLDLR